MARTNYKCKFCQKRYKSKKFYKLHEADCSHLTCNVCQKRFKTKNALQSHVKDKAACSKLETKLEVDCKKCDILLKKIPVESTSKLHKHFHIEKHTETIEKSDITNEVFDCNKIKIKCKDELQDDIQEDIDYDNLGKNRDINIQKDQQRSRLSFSFFCYSERQGLNT